MNKKILIGSIIAVAILVLMSSSSAIYVNINGDNHPPDAPEISGQTQPIVGVEYEYTFVSEDPDGDNISYLIDWGDGNITGWTMYAPSGTMMTFCHAWYEKVNNLLLRCKAKDIWNCESDWSSIIIWRSKNQLSQNIWLQLLCEKLPLLYRLVHILWR